MYITADIYNELLEQISNEFYRRGGKSGDTQKTGELKSQVSNADGTFNPFVFQEDVDAGKNYVGEHFVDAGRYIYGSEINAIIDKLEEINSVGLPERVEAHQLITEKEIQFAKDFLTEHAKMSAVTNGNDCSGQCIGFCYNTCFSMCTGTCTKSCEPTCSQSCLNTCKGTCKTTCTSSCTGSCTGSCKGKCKTTCTGGCTGCSGSCSNTCRGNCHNQCRDNCDTACVIDCGFTCKGTNVASDPD